LSIDWWLADTLRSEHHAILKVKIASTDTWNNLAKCMAIPFADNYHIPIYTCNAIAQRKTTIDICSGTSSEYI